MSYPRGYAGDGLDQAAKDRMSMFPPDHTRHFTVEKRIELFAQDLGNKINPSILVARFHHLVIAIRKEANKLAERRVLELEDAAMTTFKRRTKLHQSWYSIQERIYHFRETVNVQRRFDFDQLIEDIRKGAVDEHINLYGPQNFTITKKTTMKTIEELKNEIDELQNVRNGLSAEIELLNSKNKNAQAKRDRVEAKIDGLKWMLNESKDD